MAHNKIKFNSRAFARIIKSPGTKRLIHDTAYRMRHAANNEDIKVKELAGRGDGRPIAVVATRAKTPEAADAAREALESAAMSAHAPAAVQNEP